MRILLINNLYKPYARGGAERITELSAEALKKKGHEIALLTTLPYFKKEKNPDFKTYYIKSFYRDLGEIPTFLRLFWHVFDIFDLRSYFYVRKILKKEKIDLAITHNLKGIGFLVPRAIQAQKIKHVHTLHDIQLIYPSGLMFYNEEKKIDGFFAKIYAFFSRVFFNSPEAIIAPSQWLLDLHANKGFFKHSKKIVLLNPIKIEHNIRNKNYDVFRFLFVGQIEDHKGYAILIKAFQKIKSPNSELVVIGDGSKMENLKKMANGNDKIKILGRKNKEEVLNLMLNSDCLIVPSLCYENSPTVIYEALANGLPVLGSNIGGIPELIRDKNFLFAPSEDELTRKMEWAIENKDNLKIEPPKFVSASEYVDWISKIL